MGLLNWLFGNKKSNIDVEKILLTILKSGGVGVVQVPFETFLSYAKNNTEILRSTTGELLCKTNLQGELSTIQFISGSFRTDINNSDTLVNIIIKSELEKSLTQETMEPIAEKIVGIINEDIHSKDLAKITAYMMYCNFDHTSMERLNAPDLVKDFINNCSEGFTLFDEEYDDAIERNLKMDFYMNNMEYEVGLDKFLSTLSDIQEDNTKITFGYSILKKFILKWNL